MNKLNVYDNMALNIEIAQICGWHEIGTFQDGNDLTGYFKECEKREFIPDYCNDLNAMHEAEKILRPEDEENIHGNWTIWENYISILEKDIYATAHQRAEAFLNVINIVNINDMTEKEFKDKEYCKYLFSYNYAIKKSLEWELMKESMDALNKTSREALCKDQLARF